MVGRERSSEGGRRSPNALEDWLKFQCRQPIFEAVILQDGCKNFENRMALLSDRNSLAPQSSIAESTAMKITTGIHAQIETAIRNLRSIDLDMCQEFVTRFPNLKNKFEAIIAGTGSASQESESQSSKLSATLAAPAESSTASPGSPNGDSNSNSDDENSDSTTLMTKRAPAPVAKKIPKSSKPGSRSRQVSSSFDSEGAAKVSSPSSKSQDMFLDESSASDTLNDHDVENMDNNTESVEKLSDPKDGEDDNMHASPSPPSPADTVCVPPAKTKGADSGEAPKKTLKAKVSTTNKNRCASEEEDEQDTLKDCSDLESQSETETVVFGGRGREDSKAAKNKKLAKDEKLGKGQPLDEANSDDFMVATPGLARSGRSASTSPNEIGKELSTTEKEDISKSKSGQEDQLRSTEKKPGPSSRLMRSKAKPSSRKRINFDYGSDAETVVAPLRSGYKDAAAAKASDSDEEIWKDISTNVKPNADEKLAKDFLLNETGSDDTADEATTLSSSASGDKESALEEPQTKKKKFRKSIPRRSTKGSSELKLKNCPKLAMKAEVHITQLDATILDELRKNKAIFLTSSRIGRNTDAEDELDKSIRLLTSTPFSPFRSTKERSKKSTNRRKSKRGNNKEKDDGPTVDSSSDEGDSDRTVALRPDLDRKEKKLLDDIREIDEALKSDDDQESASDAGEGSDAEAAARDFVLDISSPTEKKRSTRSTTRHARQELKKKPKVHYKTPDAGAGVSTDSDSDASSSRKHLRKRLKYEEKESDSDTKDKKKTNVKIEESSDSDFVVNLKKKRRNNRKQAEISTDERKSSSDDSDASASIHSVTSSSGEDFYDRKQPKRKKPQVSGSGSEESSKPKKKTRRRIAKSSSDDDDGEVRVVEESDSDVQEIANDGTGSPSKRRKIRKVMDVKELHKSTRQAGKEEEERKKRVTERQKMFNDCFEAPVSDVVDKLVLDFDPKTKAPILSVDPELANKLKPHQCKGIQFMWNACFESVEKNTRAGCILAHCMGLGKTLQTIAFLHTVLSYRPLEVKCALIICPLNTVGNWTAEFKKWLKNVPRRVQIHRVYEYTGKRRTDALEDWKRQGGVAIMHYDAFRCLANAVNPPLVKGSKKPAKAAKKKFSQREQRIIEESLLKPGPDIVICDEGHVLKNATSKLTHAVGNLTTRRRIVLTGTPLQNNLIEYHTMMNFVKPSLLGDRKEFSNRFVNPIANGQHKDSDEMDVTLMKRRAHVLHKLLDGCVQRLDYSVLTPFLPPKYEYAISINMSPIQKQLYSFYLKNLAGNKVGQQFQTTKLFADHINLVKIWTHPKILTYKNKAAWNDKGNQSDAESLGSLKDFIDDGESSSPSSDSEIDVLDALGQIVPKNSKKKMKDPLAPDPDVVLVTDKPTAVGPDWFYSFFDSKEAMEKIEISAKLTVLMEILKTCESIGDKVLVFSQYLTSLDLIEELLRNIDKESRKTLNSSTCFPPLPEDSSAQIGRWRPNIEYFRIDGSTKSGDRQKQCDTFNISTASKAKLFLISTRAGGLGINLVGANRVVIFDASWNPSLDLQSIFRVFRFGQVKPCYVYRLLARGTMEEKIYNRQVVKLSLSCRVVDEQQIARHFQYDEIREMYSDDTDDKKERPVPIVPKDRLLADLLINMKDLVFSYLEHDSLLENKQEEELTEEERKAAWEEYNTMNERQQLQQQQTNRGFNMTTGDDPWVLKSAGFIKTSHPNLPEFQAILMARDAKSEVQQLAIEWDAIHGEALSEVEKIGRRVKFDQLFDSLSFKFGPGTDWQQILKKHAIPKTGGLEGTSTYLYSNPTIGKGQNAAGVGVLGTMKNMNITGGTLIGQGSDISKGLGMGFNSVSNSNMVFNNGTGGSGPPRLVQNQARSLPTTTINPGWWPTNVPSSSTTTMGPASRTGRFQKDLELATAASLQSMKAKQQQQQQRAQPMSMSSNTSAYNPSVFNPNVPSTSSSTTRQRPTQRSPAMGPASTAINDLQSRRNQVPSSSSGSGLLRGGPTISSSIFETGRDRDRPDSSIRQNSRPAVINTRPVPYDPPVAARAVARARTAGRLDGVQGSANSAFRNRNQAQGRGPSSLQVYSHSGEDWMMREFSHDHSQANSSKQEIFQKRFKGRHSLY